MFIFGKKKKGITGLTRCLFLFCLLCGFVIKMKAFGSANVPVTVYAAEAEDGGTEVLQSETGSDAAEEIEYVVKPWEAKDKFRFFMCFVFAVAICIVAAFWGDPRERLKDKYKRARKQQAQEEKKRKEQEARLAKQAEAKKAEEEAEAWEEEMKAK